MQKYTFASNDYCRNIVETLFPYEQLTNDSKIREITKIFEVNLVGYSWAKLDNLCSLPN